jgi:hypothetical protein
MQQRHAIDAQMNIDLEGMRAFVELENRGSFGDAASARALSRPTLLRRFQRFEASLRPLVPAIDDGRPPLPVTRPLVSPRASRPLGIVRRHGITPSRSAGRLLAGRGAHAKLQRGRKPAPAQARSAASATK